MIGYLLDLEIVLERANMLCDYFHSNSNYIRKPDRMCLHKPPILSKSCKFLIYEECKRSLKNNNKSNTLVQNIFFYLNKNSLVNLQELSMKFGEIHPISLKYYYEFWKILRDKNYSLLNSKFYNKI